MELNEVLAEHPNRDTLVQLKEENEGDYILTVLGILLYGVIFNHATIL